MSRIGSGKRPAWVEYLGICMEGDVWKSEKFESVNKMLRYSQLRRTNSYGEKLKLCFTLFKFCTDDLVDMNPDELVRLSKKEIESLVKQYSEKVKERTGWARTTNNYMAALRTFFRENGFRKEEGLGIVVERFHVPPRAFKREEYIPTPKEGKRMADTWGIGTRNRALLMTLLSTGLRVSTLLAITYGDIKADLLSGKDNLMLLVYPEMKRRVRGACKNDIPYYTFTTKETTEAIRAYLTERISRYGDLPDDAPLFPTEDRQIEGEKRSLTPMSGSQVRFIVKLSAKRAGLTKWLQVKTHSLRKTFNEFLLTQPSETRPNEMDRIFLMGHIPGGSEDHYLPKRVEETRAMFSKLRLERDPSLQVVYEMARNLGIETDRITNELSRSLGRVPTTEEEVAELRKRVEERLRKNTQPRFKRSKIILISELGSHLADGWTFVACVGPDSCVVEREEDLGTTSPPVDGKH